MSEKILACDNEICKKNSECERYRLYKEEQATEYKTHSGTKDKGCGKYIARTK